MDETISVLIVDDHPVVRQGLRQLMEVQPDIIVIAEAENGEDAIKLAGEMLPDVVLMDLMMPDVNGVDATREIRAASPHTQVVVLTSHHEDALVFPAIKAGALSYLLKSSLPDEVLDAVRAASRGEARLHSRVAKRLMQEVSGDAPSLDMLTGRELEVLGLIARGNSNQEIATELTLSEKTVKTHVSNILSKLQLADRTQAAIYALKQRIVPLDDEE
ncbi:MAG: DNA-binding response regulator [Chloroflexi bacterium]|nr:MAG: DNA-binding response regulator [Chloroflexota bacterium]MBL1197156.1 DNA-binding response regulator [Chloroflexota bacterium]NOH14451.1 response regulator transcription factor [Chloroflexota bacterium]